MHLTLQASTSIHSTSPLTYSYLLNTPISRKPHSTSSLLFISSLSYFSRVSILPSFYPSLSIFFPCAHIIGFVHIHIAHFDLLSSLFPTLEHATSRHRIWSLKPVSVLVPNEDHTWSFTPIGVLVPDEYRTWSLTSIDDIVSGEDPTWLLTPIGVPVSGENRSWSLSPQPTSVFLF